MGTPRGALMKAVTNAVIANPYNKPSDISELLGKDSRGVSNVLSKLYRAGVLGRKKCRYYFKGFKAQKQVKQLEINFDAPPQPESQPVAQPITHNQQLKIQALEKELYELKVQLLDQYAIIKYLEGKLEKQ